MAKEIVKDAGVTLLAFAVGGIWAAYLYVLLMTWGTCLGFGPYARWGEHGGHS